MPHIIDATGDSPVTGTQRTVWTKPFVVLVVVLAFGLVAFGVWVVTHDSRESLTIAAIAKSAQQTEDGYASEALNGLTEDTETLCRGVDGCVEGYASSSVELLRFDSKEAATRFSSERPDRYQSDWIVVDYEGDVVLSENGRDEVEYFIDSLWSSK